MQMKCPFKDSSQPKFRSICLALLKYLFIPYLKKDSNCYKKINQIVRKHIEDETHVTELATVSREKKPNTVIKLYSCL